MGVAAQSYHVCNNNGTSVEVPLYNNIEINLEKAELEYPQIGFLNLTTDKRYIVEYLFALPGVDSITTRKPIAGKELAMFDNGDVKFDAEEETNFDEIVETIITDELDDESGDFVEFMVR